MVCNGCPFKTDCLLNGGTLDLGCEESVLEEELPEDEEDIQTYTDTEDYITEEEETDVWSEMSYNRYQT